MLNHRKDPKRSGALTAMLKGQGRTVHSSTSNRGASFGRISKVAPALAVGALLAIGAQSFVPVASAANDAGHFKIESRDSDGRVADAGTITVTPGGGSGGGGGGTETPVPSGPAVVDLTELTNNFYTRKASKDGVAKPVIEIPSLTISGANYKTPTDWELVIDRKMDPFNNGELKLRNALPAWAKITYEKDRIVISNTEEWGRIGGGGENANQSLGTLQFDYDLPSYTIEQMSSEAVLDNGRIDLKLATKDDQLRAYGRWTTKVDVSSIRKQLGNPGAMHIKPNTEIAKDSGFKLTKLTDDIYTLSYEGNSENRFIKGAAAATVEPIEASRLYDIFAFDAPVSNGEASNSSGVQLKTNLQSRWNYKIEIVKLGADPTAAWSVDLNIKDLLDFDRTRTPVVYGSSNFSLVKKSADVYTLSFKGGFQPSGAELGLP